MNPKLQDLTVPRHIAIIMDGNGRWAKARGRTRIVGHRAGIKTVRDIVRACGEWGIQYLTLYSFSLENWKRPAREVRALMALLRFFLRKELPELMKNRVRLGAVGRLEDLPKGVLTELKETIEKTKLNDGLRLNLALSYGGRAEIVDAARRIVKEVVGGKLQEHDIDEALFSRHLYTADIPDPDLLIRTSGELRISNFLLWQISYAEIWVTETLWPDFSREELLTAIRDFSKRERRFGAVNSSG